MRTRTNDMGDIWEHKRKYRKQYSPLSHTISTGNPWTNDVLFQRLSACWLQPIFEAEVDCTCEPGRCPSLIIHESIHHKMWRMPYLRKSVIVRGTSTERDWSATSTVMVSLSAATSVAWCLWTSSCTQWQWVVDCNPSNGTSFLSTSVPTESSPTTCSTDKSRFLSLVQI